MWVNFKQSNTSETATSGFLFKSVSIKTLQISQKTLVLESLFNKVVDLNGLMRSVLIMQVFLKNVFKFCY